MKLLKEILSEELLLEFPYLMAKRDNSGKAMPRMTGLTSRKKIKEPGKHKIATKAKKRSTWGEYDPAGKYVDVKLKPFSKHRGYDIYIKHDHNFHVTIDAIKDGVKHFEVKGKYDPSDKSVTISQLKGLKNHPGKTIKAHQLYAHLVKDSKRTGIKKLKSDTIQSHGGMTTWKRFAGMPGIRMHAERGDPWTRDSIPKFLSKVTPDNIHKFYAGGYGIYKKNDPDHDYTRLVARASSKKKG